MRIEKFWAKNYRSLKDVTIEFDGDVDVFYGKNGAGKSNIFRGMATLLRAASELGSRTLLFGEPARTEGETRWLDSSDLNRGAAPHSKVTLGLRVSAAPGSTLLDVAGHGELPALSCRTLEIEMLFDPRPGWGDHISRLVLDNSDDLAGVFRRDEAFANEYFARWNTAGTSGRSFLFGQLGQVFRRLLRAEVMALVGDLRAVPTPDYSSTEESPPQPQLPGLERESIADLLEGGELAEALFRAKNSGDPDVNLRWEDYQSFLESGLGRPRVDVVRDPASSTLRLIERDGRRFRPLDLEGLGHQQVYVMFAQIFLSGARCVAIEEPEAHLHMPDTGVTVRRLLRKALDDGEIDQLLIASHDSVFAMDSGSYLEVTHTPEEGTKVRREADLTGIDRNHVLEPGPVVRALETWMRDSSPDEVVFRRTDTGEPVTAAEMLRSIQALDPIGREYMEQYQQFVIHLTRAKARKLPPQAS